MRARMVQLRFGVDRELASKLAASSGIDAQDRREGVANGADGR